MPSILVTGGSGQLGYEIQKFFKSDSNSALNKEYELIAPSRDELDFSNSDSVENYFSTNSPDIIIHSGALTNVDRCETEPDLALRHNGESVNYLLNAATNNNAAFKHFIYISTDFVFPGNRSIPYTEVDEVGPVNMYGQSKLRGEENLLANTAAKDMGTVLRTSWVYGGPDSAFIKWVKENGDSEDFTVNEDCVSVPTSSATIAKVVFQVIEKELFGVYHLVNNGSCTRREMAAFILDKELDEVPSNKIVQNRVAKRPSYSVLNCEKVESDLDTKIPIWQESLGEHLKEYYD
jgi:dTDP-4-dehydrorhamnose reductase